MIVGIKDLFKLFGISIIACCAVFVCTLFLNYNIDLTSIESEITSEVGIIMYNAQVSMGKVTSCVTGGCLIMTSVIMLIFYVKNYIDTHSKNLGILKALGYSNFKIAKHFWVFGLTVLVGCLIGFVIAFCYLPTFYKVQNAEGYFPDLKVTFHPLLAVLLIILPTIVFTILSILYAYFKLKMPTLNLLFERQENKIKLNKKDTKETSFLKGLRSSTLKSKKTLVFFVAFSSFCFSAMVQMSISMIELSSETFAWMILMIGLILAFITLFLSLSSVVKGNIKNIAMMRVMGYQNRTCSQTILGVYRPISYIGFIIGTFYQFGLLKMVMTFVFADVENMPEYNFDFKALGITIVAFIFTYELVMYLYSIRIRKVSVKEIMTE